MELWTPAHAETLLPALAVMLLIALVLGKLLRERPLAVRMLPIQIIACILVILEIGKQAVSLYNGYDLYHLPFHFCSLFIFALPVMAFYKGKHRSAVTAITTSLCGALFLLMLIYPNLIYSSGNIENYFQGYMDFHTVTFHNLVMLAFLLMITLQLHTPQPKGETKPVTLFVIGFCVVSATMAQILKTNYANFYTCNVPVFEELRLSLQGSIGYIPTQLLYILILTGLNIGFVLMSYWFSRLLLKLFSPARKSVGIAK